MSSVPESFADLNLDEVLRQLNAPIDVLPEAALRWAQAHQAEITPHLIAAVQSAVLLAKAGTEVVTNAHYFAFPLLVEFRAQEAWPDLRAALMLPGEGPFDLFEDLVTEISNKALAIFTASRPDELDEWIANRELNAYVRWAAAEAFLWHVRDGLLTRDEVVRRLHAHLVQARTDGDWEFAANLVLELGNYGPHEAEADIRGLFASGQLDEYRVYERELDAAIKSPEETFQKMLAACTRAEIADTVELMRPWLNATHTADDSDEWNLSPDPEDMVDLDSGYEPDDSMTVRHEIPRVGRNDPCPCGSGKKFKKCCGRS